MKITEILNHLKKQPPKPLTQEVSQNLQKIKEICDNEFSNQSFYGNAALNRKMLLDPRIARLLTPDVIAYLFTNEPTQETKIYRNSGGSINLRDAIYYGFNDGLYTLKYMTNNEHDYNSKQYEQQKAEFESNTLFITSNITIAAGVNETEAEANPYNISLSEQFEQIVTEINSLKKSGKSAELLKVPGYTTESMRSQVGGGFKTLCGVLKVNLIVDEDRKIQIPNETLDGFCEKFLQNPDAMLNGTVIHLFYDRAHIEAALEQDTTIQIGNGEYSYQDIFRTMVNKVASQPDNYPPCAKEQFYLRMGLVAKDLNNRFQSEVSLAQQSLTDADHKIIPIQTDDIAQRKRFVSLLNQIEDKIGQFHDRKEIKAEAAARTLHSELTKEWVNYNINPNQQSYEKFKENCDHAIKDAKEVLQHHRGWKDFFVKIALNIVSLALAIDSKIKTGSFDFRVTQTDSDKKLDEISESVSSMRAGMGG
ncbi:hypothetical protein [Legionella quateirensis]|uniref:Effector protein B, substrate of the Dot/Icm secretion system n=1 Tax=Legionella quateirensis TaxID=45072 RepID=A0A378KTD8_9GAMM|nr:hypothetical protein [Legionella quateirensis]KTD54693.1 effector protein B, substrate of the Dot/Icm secretion system [Legionella quateirensis]STY16871.1 LepB protein [Legionella quateirensis]